ncbi:heterokaryon incompatibility, partial [Clohesyomyces aquaticus]
MITKIGANLASAFRHMRSASFRAPSPISPLVWADQVCINQDDEEEKSHQVQLVGVIYSKASTVVSWLGADNDGEMASAITAMKSVQHVAESV